MKFSQLLEHFPPWQKMIMLALIMIVSVFITFLIGLLLIYPFYGQNAISSISTNISLLKYFQIVNQIGLFILPSFLFVFLNQKNTINYLKLDTSSPFIQFVFSGVLILIALPFIGWLTQINEAIALPSWMSNLETWMKNSESTNLKLTQQFLSTTSIGGLLTNLFMMGVLAAVGEELLFRGVLQKLLIQGLKNNHLAIIFTAIVFSCFHLQFYGFIPRLALGVLLGYLFLWTESLWIPIFLHFVNNAFAVIISFLSNKQLINIDANSFGTTDNYYIIFLSLFFSVGLAFLIKNQAFKNKKGGI